MKIRDGHPVLRFNHPKNRKIRAFFPVQQGTSFALKSPCFSGFNREFCGWNALAFPSSSGKFPGGSGWTAPVFSGSTEKYADGYYRYPVPVELPIRGKNQSSPLWLNSIGILHCIITNLLCDIIYLGMWKTDQFAQMDESPPWDSTNGMHAVCAYLFCKPR